MAVSHFYLVALITVSVVHWSSGYLHPPQVVHQLIEADARVRELRMNPDHQLFTLYEKYKQLTPEKVLRQMVEASLYEVSDLCSNQTRFLLENLKIPGWAANGRNESFVHLPTQF